MLAFNANNFSLFILGQGKGLNLIGGFPMQRSLWLAPTPIILLTGLCVLAFGASAETLRHKIAPEASVEQAPSSPSRAQPADNNAKSRLADQDTRLDADAISYPTSEAPCVEDPAEPLPISGCYTCIATPAQNGCPASVRCAEATTNGKKLCSLTIGQGSIKCETSGAHCTTV